MTVRALHLLAPGPLDQTTGGYRYARRLAEGLRALGWTVVARATDGPGAPAPAALLDGLPDGAGVLIDGLALPRLAPAMAGARWRLCLVALVHHPLWRESGGDDAAAGALRRVEAEALARVRRILVPSRCTAGELAAMGVAPPGATPVAVVPPGTDPRPAATGSGGAVPSLLTVGMVTPRKGHRTLVAALATLADLPWRLTVVGDDGLDPGHAAAVRGAVERAGLAGRVTLAGPLGDAGLAACFAGADLYVQPSHHEGYGMAAAEALACGLPVVSSAVGAAPDWASAGAVDLVPAADAGALARALRPLLEDPALRRRRAAAARAAGKALPSWDQAVARAAAELRIARAGGPPP